MPFGVDFTTTTPGDLGCTAARIPGRFDCATMPDQSLKVSDYVVVFAEGRGICSIMGTGPAIATGADGAELRAAIDGFRDSLQAQWGNPKKTDVDYSAEGTAPGDDWIAQLLDKQRDYSYHWDFDPPVDGVAVMVLTAFANALGEGSYFLQIDAPDALGCFNHASAEAAAQ